MKEKQTNTAKDILEVSQRVHTFDSFIRTAVADTLVEASQNSENLEKGFKTNINLELSFSFEKCLRLCHNGRCIIVCPSVDTRPAIFDGGVFIE